MFEIKIMFVMVYVRVGGVLASIILQHLITDVVLNGSLHSLTQRSTLVIYNNIAAIRKCHELRDFVNHCKRHHVSDISKTPI